MVEGELTHRDSTGHETRVRPGDVQRLSAAAAYGTSSATTAGAPDLRPDVAGPPRPPAATPSYEIVHGIADSTPYAVPEAGAMLHVGGCGPGERTAVPDAAYVYVHVVRGEVRLDGAELGPGDAARITARRRTWRRRDGRRRSC